MLSSVRGHPLDDVGGTAGPRLVDRSFSPGFPNTFASCVRAGTAFLPGLLSDARPFAFDVAGAFAGKRSTQRDEILAGVFESVAGGKTN